MKYTILMLLLTHPTFAATDCQTQLNACVDMSDKCEAVVEALEAQVAGLKRDQKDLVEKLADSEAEPRPSPASTIAIVGAAGIGGVIAGPVGAVVGSGAAALLNMLGIF